MATLQEIARAIESHKRAGNVEDAAVLQDVLNREMRIPQMQLVEARPDYGAVGNLTRGIGRGIVGTAETTALGLASLFDEESENNARARIQATAEKLRPDIDPTSKLGKFGEGLGSFATFAVPGGAAAKGAQLLGKGAKAQQAAALGTAGTLGVGAGAGEARERARAQDATPGERAISTLGGALVGATEVLPLGKIFPKQFELPIMKSLNAKMGPQGVNSFKDRVYRAGIAGGYEGAQEATAAILQNLIEKGVYNPKRELLDLGVAEEALIGGEVGAFVQFFTDLFYRRVPKKAKAGDAKTDTAETVDVQKAQTQATVTPPTEPGTEAEAAVVTPPTEETKEETKEETPEEKPVDTKKVEEAIAGFDETTLTERSQQAINQATTEAGKGTYDKAVAFVKGKETVTKDAIQNELKTDASEVNLIVSRMRKENILAKRPTKKGDIKVLTPAPKIDATPAPKVDTTYNQALSFVREENKPSISAIQRKFKIGFNQAAGIMERLEKDGIVSPMSPDGSRKVLKTTDLEPVVEKTTVAPESEKAAAWVADAKKKFQTVIQGLEKPQTTKAGKPVKGSFGSTLGDDAQIEAYRADLNKLERMEQQLNEGQPWEVVQKSEKPKQMRPGEIDLNVPLIPTDIRYESLTPYVKERKGTNYGEFPFKEQETTDETGTGKRAKSRQGRRRASFKDNKRVGRKQKKRATARIKKYKLGPVETTGGATARTDGGKRAGDGALEVTPDAVEGGPKDPNFYSNKETNLIDPISKPAMQSAGKNEISGVLNEIINTTKNPVIKTIAQKLSVYSDGVNIRVANDKDPDAQKVVEKLTKQYGKFDGGVFLPASDSSRQLGMENTIIVIPKPDGTVNTQTVLHEMTHAATHKILANKSHPVTRQLMTLFETVKDYSPSIFGATDVDEFVAEAFSNVNYKNFLANVQIKTQGNKYINALESFFNSIANILRTMAGKTPKPIIRVDARSDLLGMNLANKTDALISQILAPPGTSDAAPLFSFTRPETKVPALNKLFGAIGDAMKPITKKESNQVVDKFMNFITNGKYKVGDYFDIARYGAAPMHFMVELSQNEKFAYVDGDGKKQYRLRDAVERLRLAFETQRGKVGKLIESTEAMNLKLQEYTNKMGDADLEKIDQLMSRESQTNVNVDMADTYYDPDERVDPDDESSELKREIHKKLKRDYAKMSKVQKDYRKEILGNYSVLINRLRAHVETAIKESIDVDTGEVTVDAKTKSKLAKLVDEKLFPSGVIDPYVPFFREGDFRVTYQVKDQYVDPIFGNTYVEFFKTRYDMEQAILELQNSDKVKRVVDKDGKETDEIAGFESTKDDGTFSFTKSKNISSGFIGDLIKNLTAAKVPKEQQDEIIMAYIELMPGSAFAKMLQKRKGTPGFLGQETPLGTRENFAYVAGRKIPEFGKRIIQLEMATEFNAIGSELETVRKQYRDFTTDARMQDAVDNMVEDLGERMDFGKNARRGGLSNFLRRTAFFYTIGFNVSSSIINLSHLPLIVYPWLAGKYGYGKTGKAITDAGKLMNAGKTIGKKRKKQTLAGTEVDIDAPKMFGVEYDFVEGIDTYFIGEIDKKTGETTYVLRKDLKFPNKETETMVKAMQPLVQEMKDRDLFTSSYLSAELDVNEMGRKKTLLDELTGTSAYWFNYMDTRTRQTTAIANFLLETGLNEPGAKKLTAKELKEAAGNAVYTTQKLNGGTTAETGARFAQGDFGSVALMYKNYGLTVYGNLFEAAKRYYDFRFGSKVDQNTGKKESDIAFKQLVGIHGAALVVAGAQAMPLYAVYRIVANLFLGDDEEDADVLARRFLTEFGYKGPIVALTGIDYASRASLSELLFQFNRFNPDANLEEQMWFYFAGPAGGVAKTFDRAITDFKNGNVERGVEGFMPTAVRNLYRGTVRYPREGALTRRGDPVYTDWSVGDLAFQAFGFAPSEYTRANEQKMSLKNIDNAISRERTNLLRNYYVAVRVGDWEKSQDIMKDIIKFNSRHGLGKAGITADTIERSMMQHAKTSTEMWNGVLISSMNRDALRMKRDEWDDGISLLPDDLL